MVRTPPLLILAAGIATTGVSQPASSIADLIADVHVRSRPEHRSCRSSYGALADETIFEMLPPRRNGDRGHFRVARAYRALAQHVDPDGILMLTLDAEARVMASAHCATRKTWRKHLAEVVERGFAIVQRHPDERSFLLLLLLEPLGDLRNGDPTFARVDLLRDIADFMEERGELEGMSARPKGSRIWWRWHNYWQEGC